MGICHHQVATADNESTAPEAEARAARRVVGADGDDRRLRGDDNLLQARDRGEHRAKQRDNDRGESQRAQVNDLDA